ncbi:hypothetical protein GOBAR_DD15793 [Gossypium barbadense]|nr:hypothetical protein GOBAR_DD15793 [Gossypium barbadense]
MKMKREGLTSTYEDNPEEEGEENMEALDDDDEEENRGNEKKDSSFSFILNVNDAKASSFLTFSTLMQLSFMVTTC